MNVDDSGNPLGKNGTLTSNTLTGLNMGLAVITYNGLTLLNVFLSYGGNNFTVVSTNPATTTNINLRKNAASTKIITFSGADNVNIGTLQPYSNGVVDSIQAPVSVVGDGMTTLNVDDTGSASNKTGTLTNNTLTGLNMAPAGIAYSYLAALNISLGSGKDTFNILSTYYSTVTTLNDGVGNDIINVQATSGRTNIATQSGNDIINIGSLAPVLEDGITANIQGAITVTGDGHDALNVDDTGDTGTSTGTLTSSTLTGLNMVSGGITYSGLALLNVSLGQGRDTFTVASTNSATITNINLQSTCGPTTITTLSGTDFINISSNAPGSGGIVDNINGPINVVGDGATTLNVDDTGGTCANQGVLTYNQLAGLNMGGPGILYSGLSTLNISLGSGGNTFDIVSTGAATVTTLACGANNDTVYVQSTSGPTNILTPSGNDVIYVGTFGSPWFYNGAINGIQGALTIQGNGNDILNVLDMGSTSSKTGTLTSAALTGLGMGTGGIVYSGLAVLNVDLGSGKNIFTVQSTNSGTATNINIQATLGGATITTVRGTDTINVGSLAPASGGVLSSIQGAVTVVGDGNTTLNADNTGSPASNTGTLTSTALTGFRMVSAGITYSGLSALNIALVGNQALTVKSTAVGTATNINIPFSQGGPDTITTLGGVDTINLGFSVIERRHPVCDDRRRRQHDPQRL